MYPLAHLTCFKGISVTIANDSKIGLIGPNGIGKTSLLLLLAGINPPTTGKVHIARGRSLGYLRQEAVDAFADRENTVYSEMLTVFADLQEQQARLHELEARMADRRTLPPKNWKNCWKSTGSCRKLSITPAGTIMRCASSRHWKGWGWARSTGTCRSTT